MNLFFTADTHFGHRRILEFCPETRPYDSIEHHDEMLIQRWNEVVKPEDHVYHLGDVSFAKPGPTAGILYRLNGHIHLVLGNHDRGLARDRFTEVQSYIDLRIGKTHLVLFHFPIESWDQDRRGSIHLHGHTHGNLGSHHSIKEKKRRLDVGVDTRSQNYPWALEEILEVLE